VRTLPRAAQAVLEAAAVLAQPAALPVLAAVAGGDGGAEDALATCVAACEQALAAGLLVETAAGLECRHDLVRSAVQAALSAPRRQWLHRRAALALGPAAPPLALAQHWEAAGEPQTALAWRHRGALQHKDFGRLDEARALWGRIATEATDPALALRARLAQAECDLFENLDSGRDALDAVLAQVAAIADPAVRDELEAQALAGLVDNRVFAGDQPRARQLAAQLRPLLPRLPPEERVHAIEVLIELAMREPDIDEALALLAEARRLAPNRPSLASFEGQIHWFGGQPLAARAAFERLLATHPEFCSGLTIENDLAVMCHATGDLRTAEAMARRSLASWQGVAHTETLSLLVLGSTLTGAGRLAEAAEALDQAEALARRQGSQLFASEVHARRTRLLSVCGRHEEALVQAARAAPLVRDDDNPLRLSQLLVAQVAAAAAAGQAIDPMLRTRLQAACGRSLHPLVHARLARVEADVALVAGDGAGAAAAAQRMHRIAQDAGLLELQAEALLLQVRAALVHSALVHSDGSLTDAAQRAGIEQPVTIESLATIEKLAREAATLADSQGYLDLAWRGWSVLARLTRDPALAERAQAALARLVTGAPPGGFDATAAALREPRP
jgi:tetratricopeptide (TPR) repeat protein